MCDNGRPKPCSETGGRHSTLICQCTDSPSPRGVCNVANWLLVRTECGDCKALVEIEEISCGDYCKALGLKCVSQGEEVGSGCEIEQVETCDTMVKRKSICECGGAVDLGCGPGNPGPSGCDNQCGSTKVDLGCGCGVPGPSGCDNQCGSTKLDEGCGCGVTCPIDNGTLIVGVDCVQSDWIPSGACSVTCGEGTQTQTRSVLQPAERGGTCGPDSRTVTCTNGACPVFSTSSTPQPASGNNCPRWCETGRKPWAEKCQNF